MNRVRAAGRDDEPTTIIGSERDDEDDRHTASADDGALDEEDDERFLSTLIENPDEVLAGRPSRFGLRYTTVGQLGEGGMGDVFLCRDARVRREVALKVVRASGRARDRLLREAELQGKLEHPAIVPVYDLGVGESGELYFTMKPVRGVTLQRVVSGLAAGEPEMQRAYTRHRLLSAFQQVCLAVHFAHERGVVHRDLKPENIMLGPYGEVYVLDWGVAKVIESHDLAHTETAWAMPSGVRTREGTMVGTLGYMAPEQVRGDVDAHGPETDVFALGAILFELLTRTPLVRRDLGASQMIAVSLMDLDARIAARFPELEVAPELEAICIKATARDPGDRFRTARALHDAIARFLDGDQNLATRRGLADRHAREADRLLSQPGSGHSDTARAQALREVGRALAFDPDHAIASRVFHDAITGHQRTPRRVLRSIERKEAADARCASRIAAVMYAQWFVYLPFLWLWERPALSITVVTSMLMAASAVLAWIQARASDPRGAGRLARFAVVTLGLASLAPFAAGPVIAPALLLANTIGYVAAACTLPRAAYGFIGVLGLAAFFLWPMGRPIAEIVGGSLWWMMWFVGTVAMVASTWFVARVRNSLSRTERRLRVQGWQLSHLTGLPDPTRTDRQATAGP